MAAISIRIDDPVFESQTKTKLGSHKRSDSGVTIKTWIIDVLRSNLIIFYTEIKK